MKLITKEIEKQAEKLGTQEDASDPIVIARFFNPMGAGTWYMISYEPEDRIMFCYASIFNDHNNEFGYTSIDELESVGGLGIERDIGFIPKPLSEAKANDGVV
jgi:hypothetical protein